MIKNDVLLATLDQLLTPENYKDYCPNGLQVEGCREINKIITGVSLNEALIDAAIDLDAQAIIVHHGIFWYKDSYNITGIKKRRLEKLIKNDINLYAYHLPLDNHKELGNNVQLAERLGINVLGNTIDQNLLWFGELKTPTTFADFSKLVAKQLMHKPLCFTQDETSQMRKIAWCTGGADSFFNKAIDLGVDVYITGEVSEQTMSLALEGGVAYIAAGHYATERYGVMALGKYLEQRLNTPTEFIELYNPV